METKVIKNENEPTEAYTITCPHCGGKAHKVFTNGYHCNTEGCYKVSLTVNDEIGKKRLIAYSKQLNDRKVDSALTLVNLDPQSALAYIHLSRRYEENNQNSQALQSALKAYELDSNDANMCNRLGYLYAEIKNYESAVYYYLEALHHIKENRNSGFKTIQDTYLNTFVCSKALGFDAIAFYYMRKAFESGYDSTELRDYQLGWKIGDVYMRNVIERNVIKNGNFPLNGRNDQASLKKARNDMNISEKEEILYALGPTGTGLFKGKKIEKFNFAFTPYTFNIRDINNETWYFSHVAIYNRVYSVEGEYVAIKANDRTYKVHIGKEAAHLVEALNKMKNEVANNKIGSEEAYTYKCPKCGKMAAKAFTHGYHCNACKSIFVTRQDPNTNNANEVYLKYVHENNLINAQELVKADPFSANAYIYLAYEYKKHGNKQSWFKSIKHAYALDSVDANTNNRLALWYSDQNENQKAYSYISEAIKQYEANCSSVQNPTYLYINYATIVQPLGRPKEALMYIAKASRMGHDLNDLNSYVQGWGIGKAYAESLVKGVLSQNSVYMSFNSELNNFSKARSDLNVSDNVDIYYAVTCNGQYNFCINSRGVDYRCEQNGLRVISFYDFNFDFRKDGRYLVINTSNGIRNILIGQDIDVVLKMLNEIKEILNRELR